MERQITLFRGEYAFLSNMYNCKLSYLNENFLNSESAYQCNKTLDAYERTNFYTTSGKEAKAIGKKIHIRPDFNSLKIDIMYEVSKAKYNQNKDLGKKLISTYPAELIGGNWWGDTYWGVCNGVGLNILGKLLMIVRDELIKEDTDKNNV